MSVNKKKDIGLIKELDILKTIFFVEQSRECLINNINQNDFTERNNLLMFKAMTLACNKGEFSEFSIEHEYAILAKSNKLPFDIDVFLAEGSEICDENYENLAKAFNEQQYRIKMRIAAKRMLEYTNSGIDIRYLKKSVKDISDLAYDMPNIDEDNITMAISERIKEIRCPEKKMAEKLVLSTENRQLDDLLGGGLPICGLTGIGAFPGGGKTTQALNIARGIIWRILREKSNSRILLFSFDMPRNEILNLILSVLFAVPIQHIIDNKSPLDDEYDKDMGDYYERLRESIEEDVMYVITDKKYICQSEFNALIKKVSRKSKIELVIVDYIQLMVPDGISSSEKAVKIHESLKNIKHVASEFKFPVVMAVQLVKNTDRNIFPNGSHIAETGAIERECSIIYFVCKIADKQTKKVEDDVVQAILIKSRIGRISSKPTNLHFKPGTPQLLDANHC